MYEPDLVTGLGPRVALEDHLAHLVEASAADVVLMMIDLDHFKQINDTYSHPAGDAALNVIGHLVARLVSRYRSGRAFRYGGDEVAVVLVDHTLQEGVALAEHLRSEVAEAQIPEVQSRITLTIGIAGPPVSAVQLVLTHADLALQDGKRSGRNRVVVYSAETLRRETRRVVLNPRLFEVLGKTLRLALVRTWSYHHATLLIQQHSTAPLKCVSVLGPHDLLLVHLGDNEHLFNADTQPFIAESGADNDAAKHPRTFVAAKILKFHGYDVPTDGPDIPAPDTLRDLVDAAEGAAAFNEDQLRAWLDQGYVLGAEGVDVRAGQLEAYIALSLNTPSDAEEYASEIFARLLRETVLPDRRVFSVYEGRGSVPTMQFIFRTRSTPHELFDFIEHFHARCESMYIHVHTSTYIVVAHKALRVYRNLLIPALTDEQKKLRDMVIGPELTPDEQRQFRFGPPDHQLAVMASVKKITDGFRRIKIPQEVMTHDHVTLLTNRAVRATVTGDVLEYKYVYTTLCGAVENALRDRLMWVLKTQFNSIADAVQAGIISTGTAAKPVERLTFGEVRDAARAFHRVGHAAAQYLPSSSQLDALQEIIDLRNKFAHGQEHTIVSADATALLPQLLEFIRVEDARLFVRR